MIDQIKKTADSNLTDRISVFKRCIDICEKTIEELKDNPEAKSLKTEEEEINFFKEIKPLFYCQLIYFHRLYHIEINKPPGGKEILHAYLDRETRKLKRFFERNKEFYRYYRSRSTDLDSVYFVRNKRQLSLLLNTNYFESDNSFSTSQDLNLAKLLANEELKTYLDNEIASLEGEKKSGESEPGFKLNTALSVAQLGCLLRLLYEEKALAHPNQTELLQFFAVHFVTPRQENISAASLRTKYYNIDRSTSESVKDLLFQLLNRLKQL
ncbi:MAG TPA: RteC domain-containing protein [Puia sp.]|nr:RteC domain-containing protein [Puia sp.]